jgi:hypothetical protein
MGIATLSRGGNGGTRFKVFARPPFVHPDWKPDLISVSTPPGAVGPGPSDDRMYVISPIGKHRAYGVTPGPFGTRHLNLPPWRGQIRHPVTPAPDGHFDYIPAGNPEFAEAHAFATIRFVLDLWEHYFGHRIEWHFRPEFDRLEVLMLPELDTARAGYGYIEIGAHHGQSGAPRPFALSFDALAHELGHLIIYSTIGVPYCANEAGEYFGFHESAADFIALIAASHLESLIERLLEETHGNLYSYNELNRFAELSATTQVRLASNSMTMSRFAAGWSDEHELSQPLTGALFDIFVDIFQENLVARGVICRGTANLADLVGHNPAYEAVIQSAFDAAFPAARDMFREALIEAREYMGTALVEAWRRLLPDRLHYVDVAFALLEADRRISGGRYQNEIIESFEWRKIGQVTVGPRLQPPSRASHSLSVRTIVPEIKPTLSNMPYRDRIVQARR